MRVFLIKIYECGSHIYGIAVITALPGEEL
jgi:hypothetical protein